MRSDTYEIQAQENSCVAGVHLPDECLQQRQDEKSTCMNVQAKPTSLILQCPKCKAQRQVANRRLMHKGSGCILFCTVCKHATKSTKWNCSCGKLWFNCSVHAIQGFACNRKCISETRRTKANDINHSKYPTMHMHSGGNRPDVALRPLVSNTVWECMPEVQVKVQVKHKCQSQQQYSFKNQVAVFARTGTNSLTPSLKRSWADESEDILESIKRRRSSLQNPTNVSNSAHQPKGIKHLWDDVGDTGALISSAGASGSDSKQSAMEVMHAKFRAKFARLQAGNHLQTVLPCEGSTQSGA